MICFTSLLSNCMTIERNSDSGIRAVFKERRPIIAIDFDGTIVTHQFPAIGAPLPHALRVLKRLSDRKISIVIWTFRDIRSRSRDIFAQILATLMVLVFFPLFPLPGLALYMLLRPRETLSEVYERSLEEEALLQGIETPEERLVLHSGGQPQGGAGHLAEVGHGRGGNGG